MVHITDISKAVKGKIIKNCENTVPTDYCRETEVIYEFQITSSLHSYLSSVIQREPMSIKVSSALSVSVTMICKKSYYGCVVKIEATKG